MTAASDGMLTYSAGGLSFRQAATQQGRAAGEPLLVGLRPEMVRLSTADGGGDAPANGAANRVPGEIVLVTYEGADYHVRLNTPLGPMQALVASGNGTPVPARGDRVALAWDEDAAVVLADDR